MEWCLTGRMNSTCQNNEIKILISLLCLRAVLLLSRHMQWNNIVSTWNRYVYVSVSFCCDGLETPVFHVCRMLLGDTSFVTICTFWKLTLTTFNNLWNIFGHVLTLVLLNPDMSCLCKQCRSRSVGFWRSQLIWICTVCHYVCEFISTIWIK